MIKKHCLRVNHKLSPVALCGFALACTGMLIMAGSWEGSTQGMAAPNSEAIAHETDQTKSILDLQPFRQMSSNRIKSDAGIQGTVTLLNLNPAVNAWYVMVVDYTYDNETGMKKVIVLGATSAIALEVQRQLAQRACELLLVTRSSERLAALRSDLIARGAPLVLTYSAELSFVAQHEAVMEFVRQKFPDFDSVLLAYGSMHNQKESEISIPILSEEPQVDFVSAAAILTLFAAELERRRADAPAASPPSLPLPEIGGAAPTMFTGPQRAASRSSFRDCAAGCIRPA